MRTSAAEPIPGASTHDEVLQPPRGEGEAPRPPLHDDHARTAPLVPPPPTATPRVPLPPPVQHRTRHPRLLLPFAQAGDRGRWPEPFRLGRGRGVRRAAGTVST